MDTTDKSAAPPSVASVGEFGLIDRMKRLLGTPKAPDVVRGVGDDAAVVRIGGGRVHVVTTDSMIEDEHFDRAFMPMEYLGFKAMSVNVSDIVAMNACPRFAVIALGLPANTSVEAVDALYRGFRNAADVYGVTVVGGDTTKSRLLTLVLTIIGEAADDEIVYRDGARPGDALCVTGNVGASKAGLRILLRERDRLHAEGTSYHVDLDSIQYVVQRHLTPVARLQVIRDWKACGVRPSALVDISDGLASEIHHVCRSSGCGAVIHAASLPIARETRRVADQFSDDPHDYAFFGGEDYELVFTVARDDLDKLDPVSFTVLGEVTAGAGVVQVTPSGSLEPLAAGGWQHFV